MGNTNSSYLGVVGRGGTSNQTNASFQIGRAQSSFRQQRRSAEFELQRLRSDRNQRDSRESRERQKNLLARMSGIQKSLLELQNYEDTPFGPQLTQEAANLRLPSRLQGNRNRTLIDRASLRPSNSAMTAEQARTGGDNYIRMRFNDPNYSSR
jgi:hypothetical protein